MSFWDATFFELGGIIGAGVFVLIGLAAGLSGPALVLSVLIAGAVSLLTALSYAEIASALPKEGGEYAFARQLVSPAGGVLMGVGLLASEIGSSAVVSLGFASYLALLIPEVPVRIGAMLAVLAVTILNALGTRLSAKANAVVSIAKITALVLFIGFAFTRFNASNFSGFGDQGATGILAGAALFFFAFSGFGKISRLAEEVNDAPKTIPRAIFTALATSTVLYALVAFTLIGAVGFAAASQSQSPLANALESLGHSQIALLVTLGALAATFSVLLTNTTGVSRVLYAAGRDFKPLAWLTELHSSFQTPLKAVLLTGALSLALVSVADLKGTASLSSGVLLAFYAAVNGIAILARKRKDWKPTYQTPFHPLIPVLGLLSCVALAAKLLLSP